MSDAEDLQSLLAEQLCEQQEALAGVRAALSEDAANQELVQVRLLEHRLKLYLQ